MSTFNFTGGNFINTTISSGGKSKFNFAGGNFANTIIGNGRIVRGDSLANSTEIDETKTVNNGTRLVGQGEIAEVVINATSANDVTAHLYGEGIIDGIVPGLQVSEMGGEVSVKVVYSGHFFLGNLNLEISVPKSVYDLISVTSRLGEATIGDGVSTRKLQVK